MNVIFVLSLFGCVVFIIYAASLFFRKKSKQLGILMALGASRKQLLPGVLKEVLSLSCISSLTGILMGFPFVWMIWGLFRLFLVDSKDGVNHATRLTNMSFRQELNTEFAGFLYDDMLIDQIVYYVLNDADYEIISSGLTEEWKGSIAFFNVEGKDSYSFANELFHTIVNSFGTECEFGIYYDPIAKIVANEKEEVYWGDTGVASKVSYSNPDASDFRLYWAYMPKFRILDLNDMIRTFAVYIMMFLFITIVCMMAALIISYTRCQTIALNNRYVFDDLKCLGASHDFLTRELKYQCKIVFWIPSVVGMSSMYFLFGFILYGNDGKIVKSEIGGLLVCLIVLALFSGLIFLVYEKTVRMVKKQLDI